MGVPVIDHMAILQPDDPLGLHRNGVVMGDEDYRVPGSVEIFQHFQNLSAGVGIQRAGGFVG